jgi:hypothetical protein
VRQRHAPAVAQVGVVDLFRQEVERRRRFADAAQRRAPLVERRALAFQPFRRRRQQVDGKGARRLRRMGECRFVLHTLAIERQRERRADRLRAAVESLDRSAHDAPRHALRRFREPLHRLVCRHARRRRRRRESVPAGVGDIRDRGGLHAAAVATGARHDRLAVVATRVEVALQDDHAPRGALGRLLVRLPRRAVAMRAGHAEAVGHEGHGGDQLGGRRSLQHLDVALDPRGLAALAVLLAAAAALAVTRHLWSSYGTTNSPACTPGSASTVNFVIADGQNHARGASAAGAITSA